VGHEFSYRVDFENDPTATAPAQRVDVTDQLDPNLDWSTFALTEVGFGDNVIIIPTGSQYYQTTVPVTYNGKTFDVEIELGLNADTGQVYAHFLSIDPNTELPPDVLTGFLPPENGTGRGEGYFSYTIQPKAGLSTGTQIRNVALITFDRGNTIATDQVDENDPSKGTDPAKMDLNTIDAGPPTSTVAALPSTTTTPSFTVSWSGTDDTGGSGIATYDIFVSDNGGPFTPFLLDTTQTSATFNGVNGHTYAFYSVATDNVGNVQPTPTVAQATTKLVVGPDTTPPTSSVNTLPVAINTTSFTVTWSGSDNPGGSGIASYSVYVSDNGGAFQPFLTGTTATSATFTGQSGHTYGFYSIATDMAGNVQTTPSGPQATTLIDTVAPTSSVGPLPATINTTSFSVTWSGSDNPGGSGIASYDVYVSTDGKAFVPFLTHSAQTSAVFSGSLGNSYGFYSVATDRAGNRQPTPTSAQATTFLDEPPVAQLAYPAVGSTVIDWELDVRKYIDVTFTSPTGQGIDLNSVLDTGPEFTLSGAGAGSVVVNGSPTWLGGNSFRYSFTGMFANGPVNLNFIAGSFTNVKGVASQAATESFNVVVQPSLWIDTPPPVVEKNGASMVFTVRLTAPITQAVTVSYATANGTAFANKNYRSTKGTLTFGPGKPLVQTIKVPVLDDRKYGDNVSFGVNLSLKKGSIPIAQGSASGTILEGDPMPKLSIGNVTVHQGPSGTSKATFTVTLSGATTEVTTVAYATADGTATVANHDYQAASGMLSFSPGVKKETISVLINADPTYEPPETFQVRLSNPIGATLSSAVGTATIINTSPKQKAKKQNVVILSRSQRILPPTQRRTGGDLVDSAIRALMEG